MSWDLSIDSPAGPLGTADHVRNRITASIPAVDWADPRQGVFADAGYSLEFSLVDADEGDEVETEESGGVSVMVSVRGTGDPLGPLVALCRANNWTLSDGGNGEVIDLDRPSDKAWKEFQAFRDSVVGARSDTEKATSFDDLDEGFRAAIRTAIAHGATFLLKRSAPFQPFLMTWRSDQDRPRIKVLPATGDVFKVSREWLRANGTDVAIAAIGVHEKERRWFFFTFHHVGVYACRRGGRTRVVSQAFDNDPNGDGQVPEGEPVLATDLDALIEKGPVQTLF